MSDPIVWALSGTPVTDTTLTSTTVAEADYAAWSGATTYAFGDRVIKAHRIYESAAASNLNKDPTNIVNRTGSPIWWIDVSATNAWKMFDGESSSVTSTTSPLTVVMQPGFINSVVSFDIVANSVTITLKSSPGGTIVYTKTINLELSFPADWYEYYFLPFTQQTDFVVTDLPAYSSASGELTVTFTSGGVISCGMLQIGDLKYLGVAAYGAESRPKTYSYINVDEFGINKIVRRKSAKDVTIESMIEPSYANIAVEILTGLLDVPTSWVVTGDSEFSALRSFGLGNGNLSYNDNAMYSLKIDIQGLI